MTRVDKINSRQNEIVNTLQAITAIADDEGKALSAEDDKQIDELNSEFDRLNAEKERLNKIQDKLDSMTAAKITPTAITEPEMTQNRLPAIVKAQKSKYFASNEDAYLSAQFLRALCGQDDARQYVLNAGYQFRNDLSVGDDTKGGYTVPTPLAATLLNLVEQFGVVRQDFRRAIMTAMTLDVPKVDGHHTVMYPAELEDITLSDMTFGQVNLIAKKSAIATKLSTELAEDSIIPIMDTIIRDMAWSYAKSEDTNGFLGDGSATYGSHLGIGPSLQAGSKVTGSGVAVTDLELSDFTAVTSKLPMYTGISPRWYMNSSVHNGHVQDLLQALGGTHQRHAEEGGAPMLLGYPVTYAQALPRANAASGSLIAVFGDLGMGAYFGDRRAVNFKILRELFAMQDAIGVQSTVRYAINVWDTGDATNAGSIIGLYLA